MSRILEFPRGALPLVLLPIALAFPRVAAAADASDWAKGQKSAARLVSAGGPPADGYRAGVEIRLDPGALTYWRNPGDAGVPPMFSFVGSKNLKAAVVAYPAPRRFNEDGTDVFGYRDAVIFPLAVTPLDPARPVDLALDLQYAACDKICDLAEARVALRLSPADSASPLAARIAAFAAMTPRPADGPGAPDFRVSPEKGAKPSWSVTLSARPDGAGELFAVFPEGWYFDTKHSGDGFTLVLDQKPADAPPNVEIGLIYAGEAAAWEKTLRLDVAAQRP